ncbi:MAG TPA: 4'-phosphopantetheinyl transferase superfamily protein [Pseudonocardiaceae bacterium]
MAEPVEVTTVLEQTPKVRRWQQARHLGPERVLLLAAPTPVELAGQLQAPDTVLLDRDDAATPPEGGPCRLAIIAPTRRRLALARRITEQGAPWRGRDDIWFTPTPLHRQSPLGQLAFVFPGLEQGFDPRVDDVADHFGLDRPHLGDTSDLGRHGLGVFTVGRLLNAALREVNVVPDVIAGHSIGEWNAMAAAGVHPPRALEEFIASFNPATLRVPGLVFAALGCGAQQATEAISGVDNVVVSHDNCPHQSMICGEQAAVLTVVNRLRATGVAGQVLPFQSGFHSPMLAPYLRQILNTFSSLPVRSPVCPIWSATTIDLYPDDPDRIRELAARHLVEPVRFGPLIRRLYEVGVRAFVQVGSGSVPAFVTDALTGVPHLAVTANTPRRSGVDQLRRVIAALWTEGWSPRFDRLLTRAHSSHGQAVTLGLGAPLVRRGYAVPTVARAVSAPAVPELPAAAHHPVLAEFDAVLREATTTATEVVNLWAQTTVSQVSTARELSLATMPYLADHCFYRQPQGWSEPSDRYPVVPLATVLELMANAAQAHSPERTVVGIRDVQALRWLAVAPPVTVTTNASLNADGNVTVVLEGYARGTVLLAESYPPTPQLPDRPLTRQRPCTVTARDLYRNRWMFHGPAFQGVTELGPVADDGIVGKLRVPSAPGALLDNAGQLLGFWVMMQAGKDRLAFPAGIEQVRYYGPAPQLGEPVRCVVRICSLSASEVIAEAELRRSDGRLWAHVERWRGRRFATDDVTFPAFLFPERNRIAQPQSGGWFLVADPWPDPATRELFMRRYLGADERAEYHRRTPRAARQWLLGRIAVKDAVRQWLWDAGAGPVFPAEITVTNDAAGRPMVTGPFDDPPQVSLAHTGSLAAALVGPPDGPRAAHLGVGIDIEQIHNRDDSTVTAILTAAERDLLATLCSSDQTRSSWVTRFWAAKEAVAKAAGTGLGGRPHRFVVERVEGDRMLVVTGQAASDRWVHTTVGAEPEPYAVAWTSPGVAGLQSEQLQRTQEGAT